MKNLTHLSDLHQRYLQGELTKKEFEEYVFKYLLNNHERLNPFKKLENYTRRQILVLFLKSYYFVSEDLLRRVANALEMRQEDLWALVEQLRTQRAKHERAVSELKARIQSRYYRCLTIQNRIAAALPESALYERLKKNYEKATLRLQNMKTRLAALFVY